MTPMVIVTKTDLGDPSEVEEIYRKVGIEVHTASICSDGWVETVRNALSHGISAFSGNSGVGKSSLLNKIDSRLAIATGETSQKLGRGKHTTRHVQLYPIGAVSYTHLGGIFLSRLADRRLAQGLWRSGGKTLAGILPWKTAGISAGKYTEDHAGKTKDPAGRAGRRWGNMRRVKKLYRGFGTN